MAVTLGNLSMAGAVLISVAAILFAFAGLRLRSERMARLSGWSIGGIFVMLSITSGALLHALVTSNFRLEYVTEYTERALPIGYKIAAFWAGQAGSLLLWGWILALLSTIAVIGFRKWKGADRTIAILVLAVVNGFFAVLLLFAANPFVEFAGQIPLDGRGLNPALQDPGMIAHPPLLFTGYAGFAIPFAVMFGVLVAGRVDNHWLSLIRRWTLFSWLFLTAGIILGAWWAYIELGWGGYWAWDPVENASLLPWLTGTALLHSMMGQQHRGMFKRWNVALVATTFILCIFGTYITRSGVIDSVHAFAPSLIGSFFLVFLLIITLSSVVLFAWKFQAMRPEHEMNGLVSREGAFLAVNLLFVIMMVTTLIGTIFPLLSSWVGMEPVTVKPAFYNKVVAPMGLLLALVMAFGPVLPWGKIKATQVINNLVIPGVLALFAVLISLVMGLHNGWELLCVFIAVMGTLAVIVEFAKSVSSRRKNTGENWLVTGVRLIDRDHRRYGGQLTHLGMMLLIIGISASQLFVWKQDIVLKPGESQEIGGYSLVLNSVSRVDGPNYEAVQASLNLTDSSGKSRLMTPQMRFYDGWKDQPNSQIALLTGWKSDVYLVLAGWTDGGSSATLQVHLNPAVLWIWIGGIVMAIGGLFCMLPRLLPAGAHQHQEQRGTSADYHAQSGAILGMAAKRRMSSAGKKAESIS